MRWCWVSFQHRGVLLIWSRVGQGLTALAVGVGGLFGHFFSCLSFLFSFSLSLGDGRYRLKYCLKGPLSPKQPTNQKPVTLNCPSERKWKEKQKYVARPGIEPRTPDLRVRCPTDCATWPGYMILYEGTWTKYLNKFIGACKTVTAD